MTLQTEIAAFLKRTGMAETRLGRLALNDPAFVHSLRLGRAPRPTTEAKVRAFMADWKPE